VTIVKIAIFHMMSQQRTSCLFREKEMYYDVIFYQYSMKLRRSLLRR